MYKLNDLTSDSSTSFLSLLTAKWMELHKNTDIFRYKIDNLEERIIDRKYLLQLNPDRQSKRRTPEEMNNIQQPFDEKKFNFNKVSPEEVLLSIEGEGGIEAIQAACVFVGSRDQNQLTKLEIWDIRIGFNSMCGFASVNHLHYHIFVEKNSLYVENVEWHHLKGNTYRLDDSYPAPAFCFELQKQSSAQTLKEVWKILEYFLKKSIAHNVLLTKRRLDERGEVVCIIVWPRRSTTGAKKMAAFNVAVLELSGWFPIYDAEAFNNLQAKDLEKEISKWVRDDFSDICEDIKLLL